MFNIVQVGGRLPIGEKAGTEGEWTIGDLVLPLPRDMRTWGISFGASKPCTCAGAGEGGKGERKDNGWGRNGGGSKRRGQRVHANASAKRNGRNEMHTRTEGSKV